MARTVLLINDNYEITELVRQQAAQMALRLDAIKDPVSGVKKLFEHAYDLLILNPETCKVEGLDVCRKARNHTPDLAIIVISPAFDEIDKIVSLEIGADDYLALPFNPRELAARIKSLFRRASALNRLPEEDGRVDSLEFGELAIDQTHRRVTIGRKEVELTAKEFELLTFLAKKPGRPYTREQILHKLWGYDSSGYDPLITTYVARLRAKIETNPEQPRYILTVRGVGYKFAEKESLASCGAKDNK